MTVCFKNAVSYLACVVLPLCTQLLHKLVYRETVSQHAAAVDAAVSDYYLGLAVGQLAQLYAFHIKPCDYYLKAEHYKDRQKPV